VSLCTPVPRPHQIFLNKLASTILKWYENLATIHVLCLLPSVTPTCRPFFRHERNGHHLNRFLKFLYCGPSAVHPTAVYSDHLHVVVTEKTATSVVSLWLFWKRVLWNLEDYSSGGQFGRRISYIPISKIIYVCGRWYNLDRSWNLM